MNYSAYSIIHPKAYLTVHQLFWKLRANLSIYCEVIHSDMLHGQ